MTAKQYPSPSDPGFRAWRYNRGLSIRAAAAELGVSKTSIQNWEAGRPVSKTVALACAALDAGLQPIDFPTQGRGG